MLRDLSPRSIRPCFSHNSPGRMIRQREAPATLRSSLDPGGREAIRSLMWDEFDGRVAISGKCFVLPPGANGQLREASDLRSGIASGQIAFRMSANSSRV